MAQPGSRLHTAFEIGVILKGLNGLLELIGGVLLLVFPPSALREFLVHLSHNPGIARHISPQDERFAAFYLLSHGVVKGVLVFGLLRAKLWAFPWAIGVLTAFGIYQIYRYFVVPSGWLIALTVLDVAVILLAWAEWRRMKRDPQSRATRSSGEPS